MPNLNVRGNIIRKNYTDIEARIKALEKNKKRLDKAYEQLDEYRKAGEMDSFQDLAQEVQNLENTVDEDKEKLWNELLDRDVEQGGENIFVDVVKKLCDATGRTENRYAVKTINKLYQIGYINGINTLVEANDGFKEALANAEEPTVDKKALLGIVTDALNNKVDGIENAVFKTVFGTFYNTVYFAQAIAKDKDFQKALYHDKSIPKEYKDQLKRAIQTYRSFNASDRLAAEKAKLIAGGIASAPGLAVNLAGGVAGGVMRLGASIVGAATAIAALPTELGFKTLYAVGQEVDNKAAKVAAYTAGTILAIPTYAIKIAGGIATGAIKLGAAAVETTLSLVSYPLTLPLQGALKCVGTLPSTKKSDKIIRQNVANLIKQSNPLAKTDDMKISCGLVGDKLQVTGFLNDGQYKFTFDVGDKPAKFMVGSFLDSPYSVKNRSAELIEKLTEKSDEKTLENFKKFVSGQSAEDEYSRRRTAQVIADITSQKPLENTNNNANSIDVTLE